MVMVTWWRKLLTFRDCCRKPLEARNVGLAVVLSPLSDWWWTDYCLRGDCVKVDQM